MLKCDTWRFTTTWSSQLAYEADEESSIPSRPITTWCLIFTSAYSWISPSTSQDIYPREIPWRVDIASLEKHFYHTRKPFLIIRIYKRMFSWGLLPPIGGQHHLAKLAGWQNLPVTSSMAHVFSKNFHTIIYTVFVYWHCSHCGHAGFQPAIQQLFSMMMQST